jgi:TalC/MipB family fructose-6-phosphate aldolase
VKFFLDTANLDELKKGANWGIVDGVTTNPTLIAKEGRPLEDQIRLICDIVDGDISAEVVSTEAGQMVREGRELARLHKNVVVKCPLTRDGIKATSILSKDGIRVNVTLCFSPGAGPAGRQGRRLHREPVRGPAGRYRLDRHGSDQEHHPDLTRSTASRPRCWPLRCGRQRT